MIRSQNWRLPAKPERGLSKNRKILEKEMNVVTISREMGSGGTALGQLLARKLGFALIDKEFIFRAAQKAGVSERAVVRYDQEMFNKAKAVLEGIIAGDTDVFSPLALVHFPQDERIATRGAPNFNQQRYLAITQYLLRSLGRGGQLVLSRHEKTLHLRVIAPLGMRVKRVSRSQGISEDEARKTIRSRDQACARYLKHFYRRDWSDPRLYDLVINTERLSLPSAAAMVLGQLKRHQMRIHPAQSSSK
jgi:cytidylate kinase